MIFLDVDEVLAATAPAILAWHGLPPEAQEPGNYDLAAAIAKAKGWSLDLARSVMWSQPAAWWETLTETPWANRLVEECRKLSDVAFLTALPSRMEARAAGGKIAWLTARWPDLPFYVCAPGTKHHLASGRWPSFPALVDDHEANVESFRIGGGNAFLWPARGNRGHHLDPRNPDVFAELVRQIARLAR